MSTYTHEYINCFSRSQRRPHPPPPPPPGYGVYDIHHCPLLSSALSISPLSFLLCRSLQYEIYCSPPGVLTAGLTVSTVIQLATGATAGHWKLDLYDYADTNTWKNVGDLTGGKLS